MQIEGSPRVQHFECGLRDVIIRLTWKTLDIESYRNATLASR